MRTSWESTLDPFRLSGTSTKSDDKNFESGFRLYLVVFGGGWVGVKAALVIELDGAVHDDNEQKESDTKRDQTLNELGLQIVRFKNEEVLKNLSQVVGKIKEKVLARSI